MDTKTITPAQRQNYPEIAALAERMALVPAEESCIYHNGSKWVVEVGGCRSEENTYIEAVAFFKGAADQMYACEGRH